VGVESLNRRLSSLMQTPDRGSIVSAVFLGAAASFAVYALMLFLLYVTAPAPEAPFYIAGAILSAASGAWVSAMRAPHFPGRATTSFGVFFLVTALLISPGPAIAYGLAGMFTSVAIGRVHARHAAQQSVAADKLDTGAK
jgi:hypothetical protein